MKSPEIEPMVNPSEFKQKIEEIISQDYKVEFLGKNFNQIVALLTEIKAEKIYLWVKDIVGKKISRLQLVLKTRIKSGI